MRRALPGVRRYCLFSALDRCGAGGVGPAQAGVKGEASGSWRRFVEGGALDCAAEDRRNMSGQLESRGALRRLSQGLSPQVRLSPCFLHSSSFFGP